MSTLDEITKEKQRVSEALARIDEQREKLSSQLAELEATERVLARYNRGTPGRKTASGRTPTAATKGSALARSRGRSKRTASTLGEQVLALADGNGHILVTLDQVGGDWLRFECCARRRPSAAAGLTAAEPGRASSGQHHVRFQLLAASFRAEEQRQNEAGAASYRSDQHRDGKS